MSNSSGMNFDARSAPAGAAPRTAPLSFPRTTAAFTLSSALGGFRHAWLTHPRTRPSMRFTRPVPVARPAGRPAAVQIRSRRFGLSVGSHVCARASFRHPLAGLPLPSAGRYIRPHRGLHRYSYRGLSRHQLRPMPGVPNALVRTQITLRVICAAQLYRYARRGALRFSRYHL